MKKQQAIVNRFQKLKTDSRTKSPKFKKSYFHRNIEPSQNLLEAFFVLVFMYVAMVLIIAGLN